jgi:hypothetical protein
VSVDRHLSAAEPKPRPARPKRPPPIVTIPAPTPEEAAEAGRILAEWVRQGTGKR